MGLLLCMPSTWAFRNLAPPSRTMQYGLSMSSTMTENILMAKDNKPKPSEKEGWARLKEALENADKDPKKKKSPPIYEPGPYPYRALAALAYVIPIVDAGDMGKYMFEAYPEVLTIYNTLYGPLSSIYNGVPFLSFAIFFLMSYICRAPTFPVEIRFHVSQAFMLALIQFVPSILFGFLEKAGVPGMAVPFNTGKFFIFSYNGILNDFFLTHASTVFIWVMTSAVFMQVLLLNPLSSAKNPFLLNIVNWSLKYMGYTPDMQPKR